jgi:hypothetical protein
MDSETQRIVNSWPAEIKVTETVRNEKLAICQACELFSNNHCTKCNCNMVLLTWSKSMGTCPLGKFSGENL